MAERMDNLCLTSNYWAATGGVARENSGGDKCRIDSIPMTDCNKFNIGTGTSCSEKMFLKGARASSQIKKYSNYGSS